MPKIAINETVSLDFTQSSIETMLAPADYLLSGRLNNDNLYNDHTTAITIPSSKILDYPDNVRPVINNKFFGRDATEDTIQSQTLTPLFSALDDNPRYFLLTATKSYNLNAEKSTIVSDYIELNKAVDIVPVQESGEYMFTHTLFIDKDYNGAFDVMRPELSSSHDKIIIEIPVIIDTKFGSTEYLNLYYQFFILCEAKL